MKTSLETGKWTEDTKRYEPFKEKLTNTGEFLLRGTRLIVPIKLRARMLQFAHEGHPGEFVMKRRLRERVWWPNIDKDIIRTVTKCEGCRLVAVPNRPEPIMRRALPAAAWIDVAIDFLGQQVNTCWLSSTTLVDIKKLKLCYGSRRRIR